MNRRGFFAALLAPFLARLLPKPTAWASNGTARAFFAHGADLDAALSKWHPFPIVNLTYAVPEGFWYDEKRRDELVMQTVMIEGLTLPPPFTA